MSRRRWIEGFSDAGGTNMFFFPEIEREWTPSQPLATPRSQAIGSDYEYDFLGYGVSPRGVARERVRFVLADLGGDSLDDQIDQMNAQLYGNGLGKLWTNTESGGRRWSWARLKDMPKITYGRENREHLPVIAAFERESDWYAEEPLAVVEVVTTNLLEFPVQYLGTVESRSAVIEFKARSAGGFNAPTILNVSTGEWFHSSRVAESNLSILRIDVGRYAVEYSNDLGETWVDDWSALTYGDDQGSIMRLARGFNTFEYSQDSGTPDLDVVVTTNVAYL